MFKILDYSSELNRVNISALLGLRFHGKRQPIDKIVCQTVISAKEKNKLEKRDMQCKKTAPAPPQF